MARAWDAAAYHRLSDWQEREGIALMDRLDPTGDETVLDAGCGTGRVTQHLVDRLPRGFVLAVDTSPAMLDEARRTLAAAIEDGRVEVREADLATFEVDRPFDAVLSGAVFHWVLDQDALYARLHDALRPGGRLLAWCAGEGSHDRLYRDAATIGAEEPFAEHFSEWSIPIVWPSVEETVARLEQHGFTDIECSLVPNVLEDVPVEYFRVVSLSPHLDQLPEALHDEFLERVLATQPQPSTTHINRLSVDARRDARE